MLVRAIAALAVLSAVLTTGALARGDKKPVLVDDEFPPVTETEKSLTTVPFAKGAPAVILSTATQCEWDLNGDSWTRRMMIFRRTKVLTASGVERAGTYSHFLYGDWRIFKVKARTIRPDGTSVEVSEDQIQKETSDKGLQVVRVTYPAVEPGSILDLYLALNAETLSVSPFPVQDELPILESRFVLAPPPGMRYRLAYGSLDAGRCKPESMSLAGRHYFVWTFPNVEPLPSEANMPPDDEIRQTLYVVVEGYTDATTVISFAADWKTLADYQRSSWDNWMRNKHSAAESLAGEVTKDKAAPLDKAEAIRRALRERVSVTWRSNGWNSQGPDEVLSSGKGTSADVAGLAAVMLHAAGVDCRLAAFRHRDEGSMPRDLPIPEMFDDLMIRIGNGPEGAWFHPTADVEAGKLPWFARGSLALVYDPKTKDLVSLPDFAAAENRSSRSIKVSLDPAGRLTTEAEETHEGIAAEIWRARLLDASEEQRKQQIQQRLRQWVPGAQVTGVTIEHLEDGAGALVVKSRWEADAYATAAGKRLLLNPNFYNRILATDWSAGERRYDIKLDGPVEVTDTVTLSLPSGVVDVVVPGKARMDAGPVGLFDASFQQNGMQVVLQRHMRLDAVRFTAKGYPGLSRWFGDIATHDDKPVVLTFK